MMISHRHGASRAAPASLILLHGNYASPRWWEPVRQHLPSDMSVYTPDMRSWVENARTTIPDLAVRLASFVQARELVEPVIVGHSLGGVVAMQFVLDRPEGARALVLIDSGPPEGVPWGRFSVGRRLPGNWLGRRVMRAVLGKAGLPQSHPLTEALVEDALATDPAVYAAFSRAVGHWNVSGRVGELRLPALLMWGEKDPITPLKIGWRLRALMPQSRLVMLPGVGHSPPVEAPEEVVEHLLAFLGERAGTASEPSSAIPGRWQWRMLHRLRTRFTRQNA
jgi:pimeloyl-ACP methyl ester carboxylesterase